MPGLGADIGDVKPLHIGDRHRIVCIFRHSRADDRIQFAFVFGNARIHEHVRVGFLVFPIRHPLHHVVAGQDFDIVAHGWFSSKLSGSHLSRTNENGGSSIQEDAAAILDPNGSLQFIGN